MSKHKLHVLLQVPPLFSFERTDVDKLLSGVRFENEVPTVRIYGLLIFGGDFLACGCDFVRFEGLEGFSVFFFDDFDEFRTTGFNDTLKREGL